MHFCCPMLNTHFLFIYVLFFGWSLTDGRSRWTAITGQRMIREYWYAYTSMADKFVCDKHPRVTVIMSTQVSKEQDWVSWLKCAICAFVSWMHSAKCCTLWPTKYQSVFNILFPLFKFKNVKHLYWIQIRKWLLAYRILVLHYVHITIYWLCIMTMIPSKRTRSFVLGWRCGKKPTRNMIMKVKVLTN